MEWGGYLGIDKTLFNDIWFKYGDGKPNDDFQLLIYWFTNFSIKEFSI